MRPTLRALLAGLVFLAGAFAVMFVAILATGLLPPGLRATHGLPTATFALAVPLLLVVTWVALHRERASFAAVGLEATRCRALELVGGFALGLLGVALLGWALMLGGVISWVPNGALQPATARAWVRYFVLAAAVEELIFRGYLLRRLRAGLGDWGAVTVTAAVFGLYHVVNVGHALSLNAGGLALVWQIVGPAVGGVAFGVAAIRTRGLALPAGLHLGWNLAQWQVLSLGDHAARAAASVLTPVPGPYASPATLGGGYLYAMLVVTVAVLATTRRSALRTDAVA